MRNSASAALLALLGTMFTVMPASAEATPPVVRLSGELVQVADQHGPGLTALRLADSTLVPVKAETVTRIASGSAVTLDVEVPAAVRSAAAANRTLTIQGADGNVTVMRLRAGDLAAASDGSPEGLSSAIGKATVAEAKAPGTLPLEVSKVVAAAADPVSTFTPATRQVYVAVVTPAGATPQPVDLTRIRTQVAGASSYWSDVTFGALTLDVATIFPRYTSKYDCSDPIGMWDEAATNVDFQFAPNTSLVIELPRGIYGCGYGLGTVGTSPNDWGAVYVADDGWPVLAHELGHNMSLMHADALLCPAAADSAYSTTTLGWTGAGCRQDSYGDGQDIMSASPTDFAPFLSAPQSLRTGIIAPGAATLIDASGTQNVTLSPLAGRTGMRTAEVVNPVTGVTYYVEYRTAAGRDLSNVYGVKTGVRVLRLNPATGETVLLDPSPSGQSRDPDPTLPVGKTFTSYDGAVSITTTSATSTSAVVSVTIAPPLTAPAAPTAVAATAGDGSATVSWRAPTSDGGLPVTGYTVTATPGGRTAVTTRATTATVTGLINGTGYTFTVSATNTFGTSTASVASGAVTPVPGSSADTTVPMLDSFSVAGSPTTPGTSITVSYSATEASGTLQAMYLSYTDPLGGTRQIYADSNAPLTGTISQVIPAAWPSGTYTLTSITLYDPSGNGAYYLAGGIVDTDPPGATGPIIHSLDLSTGNFTVAEVPSAPSWVSVSGGNQKVDLVWSPASGHGLPITGYTVTVSPGGMTATTADTTATVTGLTNGIGYTFTVIATNVIGNSPASAASSAVTPTDPTAPTVAITGEPALLTPSATASFNFAGSDGSDGTDSLRYLCSLDGGAASTCLSPKTYAGLTSAPHTFTVRVNDPSGNTSTATYGWRVDRVIPTVAMTAPTTAYALTTSLIATWSAKDVGGGLANVDVRVQRAPYNGGFTAVVYPSTWQKTTATKATVTSVTPGYTYCFSARARDKAGNVSGWSAARCTAVALDDRSMTASTGWTRTTSSVFYRSTATVTSRSAVTLTRTGVQAKQIYLVATRCPTCGTVRVYWNGALLKTVSLYASTTTRRSLLGITTFTSVRSGTLTIRTLTSNKAIQIDGVSLARA